MIGTIADDVRPIPMLLRTSFCFALLLAPNAWANDSLSRAEAWDVKPEEASCVLGNIERYMQTPRNPLLIRPALCLAENPTSLAQVEKSAAPEATLEREPAPSIALERAAPEVETRSRERAAEPAAGAGGLNDMIAGSTETQDDATTMLQAEGMLPAIRQAPDGASWMSGQTGVVVVYTLDGLGCLKTLRDEHAVSRLIKRPCEVVVAAR